MQHPISSGPIFLILVVVVVLFLLVRAAGRSRRPGPSVVTPPPLPDPAPTPDAYAPPDQVTAVSHPGVVWERRRVLNRGETVVHATALEVVGRMDPRWRLWPQVSLGEALCTAGRTAADREAFRWINSKRADFLVVDGDGLPLAVIEYQGSGHRLGNAAERDAVKRVVLSQAGVRYVEVPAQMTRNPATLGAHLKRELADLVADP